MQYLGTLVYVLSVVVICVFMLLCGHFLGGRSYSISKNIPFESGVISIGNARIRFSIKFYIIAMVFVIFDVEGVYLYIWAISMKESGWLGFVEALIFIFILLISLIYLIRTKSFMWKQFSLQYDLNNIDIKKR